MPDDKTALVQREDTMPSAPTQPDVGAMMQFAIEQGADGLDMLERLQKIQSQREFNAAFAAFQAKMPTIDKRKGIPDRQKNIKFYYAPLEDIVAIAGPLLSAHGFSYSFSTQHQDRGVTVTCRLTHIGGHREDSTVFMPTPDIPAASAAQNAGGAITFGKRMAFTNSAGILTADADAGGEETHPPPSTEQVTEEQAADLRSLADEVGADFEAFLRWAGADTFAGIRASRHAECVLMLERKRERGAQS